MVSSPAMSPSDMPVTDVLAHLPLRRQQESERLIALMREITGEIPVVWAGKIIGFGAYSYRYDSGHSGAAPLAAFAPTVRHLTIYLGGDYLERYPRLVEALPLEPASLRGGPKFSRHACTYQTSRLWTLTSFAHLLSAVFELLEPWAKQSRPTEGLDRHPMGYA